MRQLPGILVPSRKHVLDSTTRPDLDFLLRWGRNTRRTSLVQTASESPSAQRLMQHGVDARELEAARIYVLDMQLGAAITLPIPILGPTILIKGKRLVFDEEGELEDSARLAVLRHELCHVRQILDWGGLAYMRRQLRARVKTLNLYARTAPEESVCYSAQAKVEAFYRIGRSG